MMKIIDPHLHLFDLAQGQYHWLVGDHPPPWPNLDKIRQNHGIDDLKLERFELSGFVHIEAGFDNQEPSKELYWLSSVVKQPPYKAVAYLDITQPQTQFSEQLKQLRQAPNFIGIRDITEREDAKRLLHPNVKPNLTQLAHNGLLFEAQFELHQQDIATQFAQVCNSLSELSVVINHSGFIQSQTNWQSGLACMAQCHNVVIKYSGQEHVDSPLDAKKLLHILLNEFGEQRVMFASNYPVCLIRSDYQHVWQAYYLLCDDNALWQKLSYENAKRVYCF
jgi:predicted TIM-barrel fold metal-dependent hydrolase